MEKQKTQRVVNGLYEITEKTRENLLDNAYYNEDLAPTKLADRTWTTYNVAALWVGMSVCIPTYMMASGVMSAGLSWWQAILNIIIANFIVLIPMQLNSHAGTKYGIPFPVFARLSFGIKGAHIASMARALVAAGWFGINTWIGGTALDGVMSAISDGWANWSGGVWVAFGVFWLINVGIAYKGIHAIKILESLAAPILFVISVGLMAWAYLGVRATGGTLLDILSLPATYGEGEFLTVWMGGLAANIAFWATLALNIPDFSRYAKTQKDQFMGQLLGLPTTMGAFAFVGVFVTGASRIIFGEMIWDPVVIVASMDSVIASLLGAFGIALASLSTNIAANVVAPANGISNLNPKKITYKMGIIITGLFGIVIMPWKLLATAGAYIFGWLGTYGLFLGPLAGMFVADYYIYRKKMLDLDDLFRGEKSRYWYGNGFNYKAIWTWIIAGFFPLLGKVVPSLSMLASAGWMIGFVIALIIYPILMKNETESIITDEMDKQITEVVE